MKDITFPELNIKFSVNNIAFRIGNINIYWYAILIVFALGVALIFCKKDDRKYQIKFEDILEIAVITIPISIIGARLYFVVFHLEYYILNPNEILNIRNGGLAIYGGIIGAVITIAIYAKLKKMYILDIFDYVVPYLALGQAIGRWGNFFNREAYGIETNTLLRMGIIKNGRYIEVHPTFLYESICDLILFLILYCLRKKRKYKGQITYIYLALYGLVRAIIEGIRIDSLMLGSVRVSQILSVILCTIFTLMLLYKKRPLVKEKVKKKSRVS